MMVLIKQLSERNKFTVHDEEPQKTSPVELNYYEEVSRIVNLWSYGSFKSQFGHFKLVFVLLVYRVF